MTKILTLDELLKEINGIVIGGAVRDFILHHDNIMDVIDTLDNASCVSELFEDVDIKDIDIASAMTPDELLKMFDGCSFASGEAFGTVSVRTSSHDFCEITTFRDEVVTVFDKDEISTPKSKKNGNKGKEANGTARHPIVTFSKEFRHDAKRRDIPFNALGINSDLELVGDFQGIIDLSRGIVRAIGNPKERIITKHGGDALRSLRVIRFSNRFNFIVEPKTEAVVKMVNLKDIAPTRILMEMEKIFKDEAVNGIKMLDEFMLLEKIIPELIPLKFTTHSPIHHPEGNPFEHTLSAISKFNNPEFINIIKKIMVKFNVEMDFDKFIWISQMCILHHDIGKFENNPIGTDKFHQHDKRGIPIVQNIAKRMLMPKELSSAIEFSVENHMKMFVFDEMTTRKKRWLCRQDEFIFLLITHIADSSSRLEGDEIIDIDSMMDTIEEMMKVRRELPKLVSGHDAMAHGFVGKDIGMVMKAVEIAQVENKITTRDEALTFISNF